MEEVEPDDIRLEMTCGACPEQYDAFVGEEQVGYLRLRHGHFSVHRYDPDGPVVFTARPVGDGVFDPGEREHFLQKAREALARG